MTFYFDLLHGINAVLMRMLYETIWEIKIMYPMRMRYQCVCSIYMNKLWPSTWYQCGTLRSCIHCSVALSPNLTFSMCMLYETIWEHYFQSLKYGVLTSLVSKKRPLPAIRKEKIINCREFYVNGMIQV